MEKLANLLKIRHVSIFESHRLEYYRMQSKKVQPFLYLFSSPISVFCSNSASCVFCFLLR